MEIIGYIAAVAICYFIGKYIGIFLDIATEKIELINPEGITEGDWKSFVAPEGRVEAGKWLGVLERILVFLSFYVGAHAVIGGWLVFKVGSKWQVWSNVIKIPNKLENCANDFSFLLARQRWGSWLHTRLLLGTLSNVLVGFFLAVVLKKLVS